jgi:hypothetical protein
MIGISAFRSAWRASTTRSRSPFARAVRMKSLPITSSIADRVMRARNAIERVPNASAGSTRYSTRPNPDGGSQRSVTAKIRIRISPTQ